MPEWYRCNLDADGLRRDRNQRPELCHGSVEFPAPASLWGISSSAAAAAAAASSDSGGVSGASAPSAAAQAANRAREPLNMCYIYALDASVGAVRSGFFASAVAALRESTAQMAARAQAEFAEHARYSPAASALPRGPFVAVITYGATVQLQMLAPAPAAQSSSTNNSNSAGNASNANLNTRGDWPEAETVVMTSAGDPFLPVPAAMCVSSLCNPASAARLDAVLAALPAQHARDVATGRAGPAAAVGAAAKTAVLLFEELAGPGAGDRKRDTGGHVGSSDYRLGGGRVLLFSASLPNHGAGALPMREDAALYSNVHGSSQAAAALAALYAPAGEGFYEELGVKAVGLSLGFDLFSCRLASAGSSYADVATVSALSTVTGGQLYRYYASSLTVAQPTRSGAGAAAASSGAGLVLPGSFALLDGETLAKDVRRNLVTRAAGANATLIIRVSRGLAVAQYYGNFYSYYDNLLATVDADKAVGFRVEYRDTLSLTGTGAWAGGNPGHAPLMPPSQAVVQSGKGGAAGSPNECCVQAALLYTTASGHRRIRVHTLSLPIVATVGDVFTRVDLDTIVALSLKQAAEPLYYRTAHKAAAAGAGSGASNAVLLASQDAAVNSLLDCLYAYRKYVCVGSVSTQLILPDTVKLLPVCTLGLIKSELLQREGTGVRVDDRTTLAVQALCLPAALATTAVVPRLYDVIKCAYRGPALSPEGDSADTPPGEEPVRGGWPTETPQLSSLSATSIFVLDDARTLYVYVGSAVPAHVITALFKVHAAGVTPTLPGATVAGAGVKPLLASVRARGELDAAAAGTAVDGEFIAQVHATLHDIIASARRGMPAAQAVRVVFASEGAGVTAPPAALGPAGVGILRGMRTQEEIAMHTRLIFDRAPVRVVDEAAGKNKSPASLSYVDFLCFAHRKIMLKLAR